MFCVGKSIEMSNIRFVRLNGCNTMSGQRKGLQRRNISPLSLYVNCRNHRLALWFVHLMKNNNLLVEVDALLIAIWKMLHFSSKKAAVFKNMQEVYGQRPIKFIRASTTRWLYHLHAWWRFISRFETLLDTLDAITESTHEPDVQGMRNCMMQKDNISTIVVLADILKPLPVRVKSCTDELHSILQQYEQGNYDYLEYSKCQMMFDLIDERTDFARRMRNHHEVSPEDYLQQHGIPMVYRLIGEIEDSLGTTEPVLATFDFLEPNNIPGDIADILAYGKKVDEFEGHRTVVPPELGNADIVHDQLLDFRRQMFMYKHQGHDTVQKMYMLLLNDSTASRAFPVKPHLFKLALLALLIPQSTAVVERGFSLMNDIATE
ncbi:hypothetical protein MAR_011330 [Mya arenaria]|uniref:HAT C-terminal dimerisation domain-containing protein n=1 Tax=Mya arenaria TaxID=6604 RepID=A0ABY7FY18_MYAAR|nr:hypothetical protein MAR_011330 [Mya arenaria]